MTTSKGHIGWTPDGEHEYYERDGEVFKASRTSVLDIDGYRCGRWECSRAHFDRFRSVYA